MENQNSAQAQNTLIAACLFVIATITLAVALSYTRSLMIPFVFALFLSYFVKPVVSMYQIKLRMPHWAATMGAVATFLAGMFFFVMMIRGSILQLIDGFYLYEEKLYRFVQVITDLSAKYGIKLDEETLLARVKDLPVFSFLQSAAGTAATFLLDFLLVLVFLIFLLVGAKTDGKKTKIGEEIDAKIRGYILTKVATSGITAILVLIVYFIFDLDLALMFSLLCFVFCFIPTVGSIIATILPLPIALIQYEDKLPILCVTLIPAAIQLLIGNIVEPKMLGKGLDLHPITILLSLMFWGLIWGVAGMFLAVPITAVLKIILEKIPLTYQLSQILAGRSPI